MKKNISKPSVKNGVEAPVNPDAKAPQTLTPASKAESCKSLQVLPCEMPLPDEPEALGENQPLTEEEDQDLKRCETVIEENRTGFEETCAAMNEIWSKRLFRIHYKSFEEYCTKKWGFGRAQGYRLVKAHQTMKKVSPMGDTMGPMNERQIRELAKVPEEKRVEVLKEAKKKAGPGKMTSNHIKQSAEVAESGPIQEQEASVPPTTQPLECTAGNIITAAVVFPGAKPISLAELSEMADKLYNIFADPSRRKEAEKLLFNLKSHLQSYAKWEKTGFAPVEQQEAA